MPELTWSGGSFPLKTTPPKPGRIMLLMRAERRGDEAEMAASYLDFLESLLDETVDRRAFEDAVAEMDADELGDLLRQAGEAYGTSAKPLRGRPEPPDGETTRRVVSFSKGTVEVDDAAAEVAR